MPQHPESTWRVHDVRTTASEQHGRDLPAERSVWNVDVINSAIVLGSRQSETELDLGACMSANVEVVRRRSGGGMVFLSPGNQVWLDVVIPKNDPLWIDDVGRASWWLGDVWLAAIKSLAPIYTFTADVYRENLDVGEFGDLVCFSGMGPGEVMSFDIEGVRSKLVGISQRRTQEAARFQCTAYLQWGAELSRQFCQLFSNPNSGRAGIESNLEHSVLPLSRIVAGLSASDVVTAFMAQLARV